MIRRDKRVGARLRRWIDATLCWVFGLHDWRAITSIYHGRSWQVDRCEWCNKSIEVKSIDLPVDKGGANMGPRRRPFDVEMGGGQGHPNTIGGSAEGSAERLA